MRTTYWKRVSLGTGKLIGLFKKEKTEKEISGYRYKDGKWEEDLTIAAELGYNDDYDDISEEEARELMTELGER